MGRWAQHHKRGGLNGPGGGLPAGPEFTFWTLDAAAPIASVTWLGGYAGPFSHWRSRWRSLDTHPEWQDSASAVQLTSEDASQDSPLFYVAIHPQDCEVAFCSVDGVLLSQWSAYQTV